MAILPLRGIRVADFSQVVAGPGATLWFSVLGADVIKIENPARPDSLRRATRDKNGKFVFDKDPRTTLFPSMNVSKKSCTLDLKTAKGQEIARQIVRLSDVVVENFSTGVMDRFGLGYQDIRKVKPDIVMVSVSGFGRTGPNKDYLAYASIGTAGGGLNAVTGYEGGEPQLMGGAWGDLLAAKFGALMALIGLEQRRRTGRGLYADLSMSEVMTALIPDAILDCVMNGPGRWFQRPRGNQDSIMAPHNAYPCKGDGSWAVIAVSDDREWAALCDVIQKPELKTDPRFNDQYQRWVHRSEIDPVITGWTVQHTNQEVMHLLQAGGVPAACSSTLDQIARDPHLQARDRYVTLPDYRIGQVSIMRVPGTTSENSVYTQAPAIGEHNTYVLWELLGMAERDIQALEEEAVIAGPFRCA